MITNKYWGSGVGIRPHYVKDILSGNSTSQWYEAISENYFSINSRDQNPRLKDLIKIREQKPIALHGVSLNLGSADPLNMDYLKELKRLGQIVEPIWHSDHLCWTGVDNKNLSDLMPLPYTDEAILQVVSKITQTQEHLGSEILVENVSSYVEYKDSQMSEQEFVSEIVKRSGCYLLLDINNVFVSSYNHGFDPLQYLEGLPHKSVRQIHLAGPEDNHHFMVDTHDQPIRDEVWALYEIYIRKYGRVSTLIERDGNLPKLVDLEEESSRASRICGMSIGSKEGRNIELTL